jgi:hypothetical protein
MSHAVLPTSFWQSFKEESTHSWKKARSPDANRSLPMLSTTPYHPAKEATGSLINSILELQHRILE